jgi:hypothetical protein
MMHICLSNENFEAITCLEGIELDGAIGDPNNLELLSCTGARHSTLYYLKYLRSITPCVYIAKMYIAALLFFLLTSKKVLTREGA